MSTDNEIAADLQKLLDRLVDGTIADEGLSQLDRALRDRPATVEYFLDYCQLHIDLAIDLRADRALESFRHRQQQVAAPVAVSPVVAPPIPAPLPVSAEDGPFAAPSGQTLFGFSGLFSFGIAACALMLVAAAGLWWWSGARELEDRTPLNTAKLIEGGTPSITSVQLGSGTTTLELANIGSVVVEGPADFQLLGPMRARLNKGRIKVHVTETTGHGFVVETPDGEVTDLGTEFGLDVASQVGTGLVVFQGMVDLRLGQSPQMIEDSRVERLFGGDGVRFSKVGQLDRIMSIVTGNDGTFRLLTGAENESSAIITHVSDNIRTGEMKKFYEIVPGGLREDALAYVDRQEHEWNGLTQKGIPSYLIGADYVKPFNSDKTRSDLEIEITLGRPARLFVIFDDRIPPPEWLRRDFQRFGDRIGLDMGKSFTAEGRIITTNERGAGPAQSIDQAFSIWERQVPNVGRVKLGAATVGNRGLSMYGIAAVPMETEESGQEK